MGTVYRQKLVSKAKELGIEGVGKMSTRELGKKILEKSGRSPAKKKELSPQARGYKQAMESYRDQLNMLEEEHQRTVGTLDATIDDLRSKLKEAKRAASVTLPAGVPTAMASLPVRQHAIRDVHREHDIQGLRLRAATILSGLVAGFGDGTDWPTVQQMASMTRVAVNAARDIDEQIK
jgi:hypothetical protein